MTILDGHPNPAELTLAPDRPPARSAPPPSEEGEGGLPASWSVGLLLVALFVLLASMAGIALSRRDGGSSAESAGATRRIDADMVNFAYVPSAIDVAPGTRLVLNLKNSDTVAHDLQLSNGRTSPRLLPGETGEFDVGVVDAGLTGFCTVAGHRAAGMTMAVNVGGDRAGPAGADRAASAVNTDAGVTIDPNAKPAADWQPYDPSLRPAPGGVEHKLTLRATEKVMAVAPGVTQEMWTFDDVVPGPVLRGKVGDLFTVTLVNDGEIGHSVDFHASKVAWNDEMRTIQPGESIVYQFQAKYAGAFMYHCGTPPTLHHIGNGMYGTLIVDPPELAAVDHEYVLVQSELYLGPQGQPGDLAKMQGDHWDAVVFNGYHNQYLHAPIRVEPGERVRVWVLDAGPSENSAFHVVGTVFDTVFKEGAYRLRPDQRNGGAQVLDLQPAQGGFVEFSFDEAGLYPIVTHKFSNAARGALGLFQAGEVGSVSGAGH
jgi:nitrite reductase (NO-forming)